MIDVENLTKSLSDYSPVVNEAVNTIVKASRPIAYILISIFFLLELLSWYQYVKREGGGITVKMWIEIAMKYMIAYMLVGGTTKIFNVILWFFNKIALTVDGLVTADSNSMNWDVGSVKGIMKTIIKLLVASTEGIAKLYSNILILVRFMQMYVLKSIAPLMVAFYVNESTKQLAINFFKQFAVYALQGLLLVIVTKIYGSLMLDSVFNIKLTAWSAITVPAATIAKGVVFILLLHGTNRLAKTLLGVM